MTRQDLAGALGLLLFAGGVWWVYPPAALILVGLLLLIGAWVVS